MLRRLYIVVIALILLLLVVRIVRPSPDEVSPLPGGGGDNWAWVPVAPGWYSVDPEGEFRGPCTQVSLRNGQGALFLKFNAFAPKEPKGPCPW